MANSKQTAVDWKKLRPASFVAALVFFALLWALDFPKPMIDDLFYNGAALNLAGGGDFSNPLLDRQHFPGHFFFVYPPLHSYAVYGWLKIFGISAGSLLAFQAAMYFVITAATIVILRHHGAPRFLEWLVPPGITAALLYVGLRPEPFSAALMMAGYALFERWSKGGFRVWLELTLISRTPPDSIHLVTSCTVDGLCREACI